MKKICPKNPVAAIAISIGLLLLVGCNSGSVFDPLSDSQPKVKGDINCDGEISAVDVVDAINHILGMKPLSGDAFRRADCNGDGTVYVSDVVAIVNMILHNDKCVRTADKAQLTPEIMEYLESLESYFRGDDFMRFMALLKTVPVLPSGYSLSQNYPNPFNATTSIAFALPEATRVRLEVLNISYQVVTVLVDSEKEAGYYTVSWNGRECAAGIYHYRFQAGGGTALKQMILLK